MSSWSQKSKSEVSHINLRFLKIPSKNGRKNAELFPCCLTTWWNLWLQNWYQMIDTNFRDHNIWSITFITWTKSNNLAIFRPFSDLQDFFKNRGFMLETSAFDFLINSTSSFIWLKNIFSKKNQILNSYFEVPYIQQW